MLPAIATCGTDLRDEDDVARLEGDVLAFVPAEKEIVEIEVNDRVGTAALDLDVAQTALRGWAARGEEGVQQAC